MMMRPLRSHPEPERRCGSGLSKRPGPTPDEARQSSWSDFYTYCKLSGLAVILLIAGGFKAWSADFYTLLTTGPASNRICIVFLSEGYTSGETNTFRQDCTNALKAMFGGDPYIGEQPFVEYSAYFNAYAIFTNSANSGVDHWWTGSRDTAFNCAYDSIYDYVITNDATGQARVNSLLATFLPTNQFRYRMPVLLVNEPLFQGGSGGTSVIVSTCAGFQGILTHETGHVLAGLGDEYEAIPSGQGIDANTFPAEPNTTTNSTFASIPWKAWINTNTTPIPTPGTSQYFTNVGLFEGAHYSPTGWYRPRLECRMRSVTTDIPLCEVCREALVKSFYTKIRAIDAFLPTNPLITLSPAQVAAFSVSPLQPLTHQLAVQWRTNGVNVAGATNTTFLLSSQPGLTNLSAVVRDNTDWVRNDPSNLLASTNTWALSSLWLESPLSLAGGKFRFTVRGLGVTNFTIKASTNLITWTSIATNSLNGGQFSFTNSGLTLPWRYYRALSPPE